MRHSPRHALRSLSWKARTGAVIGLAGGAIALGSTLPAGIASASSYGCNAQVGCATLNSHQTDGTAISMDARWQESNAGQYVIGYPDLKLDKATSFDKVAHTFRHGALRGDTYYTFVYAPTGDWSNMCVTAGTTGLLTLQVCTHGDATSQQFIAGRYSSSAQTITAPATIPNYDGNNEYVLENVGSLPLDTTNAVSTWTVGAVRLLEARDTGNPVTQAIPKSTPTATDPRQLDVNGGVPNETNTNDVVTLASGAQFTPNGTPGNHETFTVSHVASVATNAQWNWHT